MTGVEQAKIRILPGGRDGRGKVDRKNLALALNRTPKTMAEWKRLGIGPQQYNIGGRSFSDWTDVEAYEREQAA